jgi:5-methylcytosine-specific restriction endonuclease McrA
MKEQILKLRLEGKSYSQIKSILGCSKGTIAFHCGKGQKHKYYANTRRRHIKLKQQIKEEAGGKCSRCGYNKCLAALEFHHINDDKKQNVSWLVMNRGIDTIKKEIAKCILLCANCHREIHC